MVKTTSSKGGIIQYDIRGISEVMNQLRIKGQKIVNNVDLTIVKMGTFVEGELRQSIAGKRAEPKSVDSGSLLNSIRVEKVGTAHVVIEPQRRNYGGSSTTTQDVAKFMEFGTSRGISPRRHFRNTVARNMKKVRKEVQQAVKKAVR